MKFKKEKKAEDNGISEEEAAKQAAEIIAGISYVLDQDVETVVKELIPLWTSGGELGNQFFNNIQFTNPEDGKLFAIIRDDYLEWLNKYGADMVTKVNDTTKEITRRVIQEGLVNGDSINTIADNLVSQIDDYSKDRAVLIASNETHISFMTSNFMTAEASEFEYKTWVTVNDSHVRVSHQALNGKKIKINEEFTPGLYFPGDSRAPAATTIRCRCVLFYE